MSRLQLALNVTNLEQAIDFHARMFATAPAKVKPGYANFAIADPPLKLVLFEGPTGATINQLGVEAEAARQVRAAEGRLRESELDTTGVDDTMCCYAQKTETWVSDPDGARWEWYVQSGDADQLQNVVISNDAAETERRHRRPAVPESSAAMVVGCGGVNSLWWNPGELGEWRGARLTRRVRQEYRMYFDRNAR